MDRSVARPRLLPVRPLPRALEVQAGYRNIGFDTRVDTDGFSTVTGQRIHRRARRSIDAGDADPPVRRARVALVRDTSVFGATSPVLGQRFRLDVSPVLGSVNYTGALVDFRQYVMPVRPVTIAGRVLHYGRYGAGGEDPRLGPLFLGYPSLVRGYDTGSFTAAECGASGAGCPVYDQLLGSRMLVGEPRGAGPAPRRCSARSSLYGPLPDRDRRLLRRRRGVGHAPARRRSSAASARW